MWAEWCLAMPLAMHRVRIAGPNPGWSGVCCIHHRFWHHQLAFGLTNARKSRRTNSSRQGSVSGAAHSSLGLTNTEASAGLVMMVLGIRWRRPMASRTESQLSRGCRPRAGSEWHAMSPRCSVD